MGNKKTVLFSALFSITLVFGYTYVRQFNDAVPAPGSYREHELVRPYKLPEITASGLTGKSMTEAYLKGRVVLLHFWATWCSICRDELPRLEAFEATHKSKGVAILGVLSADTEKDVIKSNMLNGRSFPNLLDEDADISARYKVRALPNTLLVDPAGQILYRVDGPLSTRDVAELDRILTGMAPTRI